MISDGLPSNEELQASFDGAGTGYWVCWVYPVMYQDKPIKVWNRSMKPPLSPQYAPIGCVEVQL